MKCVDCYITKPARDVDVLAEVWCPVVERVVEIGQDCLNERLRAAKFIELAVGEKER